MSDPAPPRRRRWFRILAVGVGSALAVAGTEAVLRLREDRLPRRVLQRLGAPPFRLSESSVCVYDGPWGFRGKPNLVLPPTPAEPELVRGGVYRADPRAEPVERVGLTLDEDGFRNPPGTDRADVVVVGDSFAFGWNLPREASWPALLAAQRRLTVYSLGFNAYGPSQGLAVLERFGWKRAPRHVVWTVFLGNDLDDEAFYRRRIAAGPAAPPPPVELQGSRLGALLGWLTETPPPQAPAAVVGGASVVLGFTPDALRSLATPARAWLEHPGLPGLVDVLKRAKAACAERKVELRVVLIPAKESLLYPVLERADRHALLQAVLPREVAAVQTKRAGEAGLDLLDERLRENAGARHAVVAKALAALDLTVIDLRDPLRADYLAGQPPYFALDSHWNRRGQETCAAAVSRALR